MTTILLGSVALEPNRWGTIDPSRRPVTTLSHWLPAVADAGFDGVELWEGHVTAVDDLEAERVLGAGVPLAVFNTYASFDEQSATQRSTAAAWVGRTGADGVKYNVGNDAAAEGLYVERVAAWLSEMPAGVRLLCECHVAISIAEHPAVAARMFAAIGPPGRVQAIVHATSETPDHLRARFDAYGDRIGHVHLNDPPGWGDEGGPRLADIRPALEAKVALLRELGFAGTWTVEFVHGTMTDHDEPGYLLDRAVEDLAVLRDLLG